jgi:nucleotide-binding universal stress UspA family protein
MSRRGAELPIALAQASHGRVTALHVADHRRTPRSWRRQFGAAIAPTSSAEAIIREIVRLGDHYGVQVCGIVRHAERAPDAILRQLKIGDYNLLVMGVSPRPGEPLYLGRVASELLDHAECSVLFVAGEGHDPGDRAAPIPDNAGKAGTRGRTGRLAGLIRSTASGARPSGALGTNLAEILFG